MCIYEKELKAYGANREAPKHCWLCGRKLLRKYFWRPFNKETGEAQQGIVLYCPAPWYMKWQAHTKDKFDENGNEIIQIYY